MSAALLLARVLAPLVVCALLISLAPPASSQVDDDVSLYLLDQPVWHEPDDPFGLRLRVSNRSTMTLEGFRLQVRVFSRARTRSELEANFDVDPARFDASSYSVEFPERTLPAGGTEVVDLSFPISRLASLATTSESGIYPVTITITDAGGFTRLGDLTTQLIYLPTEVEKPLHIAPLWQLVEVPSRTSGGYQGGQSEGAPVEQALSEGGWLRGVGDALASGPGEKLRLGLAPLPRLIEELADVGDGYERTVDGVTEEVPPGAAVPRSATAVLASLRNALERDVQPVTLPYALPDLPSLIELEQTTAQLNAAAAVLDEVLGVPPDPGWVFPPSGRLDGATLESLLSAGAATNTFVSSDVIELPGVEDQRDCQEAFLGITHTCPVVLTTPSGRADAYVLDEGLQERFGALVEAPRDRVALQRLFAETAMIWAELPGTSGRVVTLSTPALWHPPPWISRLFVRTLVRAPWLKTVTPRQGLELDIDPVQRDLVGQATVPRSAPASEYLEEVAEVRDVVESFARIKPPLPMIQRLRRDVLTAQSRLWWGDAATLAQGAAFATDARSDVEKELGKITIAGRRDITLTSRTGDIPLVLLNRASYPVSVEVVIENPDRDLRLSQTDIPTTFEPGATPLPLEATARSSGIFVVGVTIESPDGYVVHETDISIRSTEFNQTALAVTLGALGFLVLFYVGRRFRRRDRPADAPEA